MLRNFIGIVGYEKVFDCGHLLGKYFKDELGIDLNVEAIPRNYPTNNEHQYIINALLSVGFVRIPVEGAYQKGDAIVYRADVTNRYCIATCVDDVQALIMRKWSRLIHIDRLENKTQCFRHKSLMSVGVTND